VKGYENCGQYDQRCKYHASFLRRQESTSGAYILVREALQSLCVGFSSCGVVALRAFFNPLRMMDSCLRRNDAWQLEVLFGGW